MEQGTHQRFRSLRINALGIPDPLVASYRTFPPPSWPFLARFGEMGSFGGFAPFPWPQQRMENRAVIEVTFLCENSHCPTRQRESRLQGCKSAGHAQRFLAAYGPMAQHFHPRRHRLSASAYRAEMHNRFASWAEITGTERAASASGRWQSRLERLCCCLATRSSPTT
jgi:hypothetical protein